MEKRGCARWLTVTLFGMSHALCTASLAMESFVEQEDQQDIIEVFQKIARQEAEKVFEEKLGEQTLLSPRKGDQLDLNQLKAFIPEIVEIHFQMPIFDYLESGKALTSHMGTGFIFDAAQGIICTNHHVVPSYARGKLRVILSDGEEFEAEVEHLDSSPGEQFGDFTFLRIKELAGRFSQMVIKPSHFVNLQQQVAFMGNSSGSFSIETGLVNDPYNYQGNQGFRGIQSFRVQLNHKGGASGSPVFNSRNEIVGILFAGDDTHATILPIWYACQAYEYVKKEEPIIAYTLEHPLHPMGLLDLHNYKMATRKQLKEIVTEDPGQCQRFLTVQPFAKEEGKTPNDLHRGDIIVRANNQLIGLDSIKLFEILKKNDVITLDIIRWQQPLTLQVSRLETPSAFMDHVDLYGNQFYLSNNRSSLINGVKAGMPIYCTETTTELVRSVGYTRVETFSEFITQVCERIYKKKAKYFHIKTKDLVDCGDNNVHLDVPEWEGEIYIDHFDRKKHHWINIPIIQYNQVIN